MMSLGQRLAAGLIALVVAGATIIWGGLALWFACQSPTRSDLGSPSISSPQRRGANNRRGRPTRQQPCDRDRRALAHCRAGQEEYNPRRRLVRIGQGQTMVRLGIGGPRNGPQTAANCTDGSNPDRRVPKFRDLLAEGEELISNILWE